MQLLYLHFPPLCQAQLTGYKIPCCLALQKYFLVMCDFVTSMQLLYLHFPPLCRAQLTDYKILD